MNKVRSAFFTDNDLPFVKGDVIEYVYARGRRQQVARLTDLYPVTIGLKNFDEHARHLADLEVIFSTWGMPQLEQRHLDQMPNLQAVFYAAGSVKSWATPFLQNDIIVVSAAAANAVPVAEFCLGQILLAAKGYFRNTRDCRTPQVNSHTEAFRGRGTYGEKIAIIGAGQVGRQLIRLLRHFTLQVLVVDPYLSPLEAQRMGIEIVTLEEAFSQAYVVSNHLPDLPELRGVLDGALFASMRPNATFINTGRGAQVNEPELIEVLRKRPDLTALLDVTDPEPAPPDSPLYTLPNVQLSSHIAGAHDDEVVRMADTVIEEFKRWHRGAPLRHRVQGSLLARMA